MIKENADRIGPALLVTLLGVAALLLSSALAFDAVAIMTAAVSLELVASGLAAIALSSLVNRRLRDRRPITAKQIGGSPRLELAQMLGAAAMLPSQQPSQSGAGGPQVESGSESSFGGGGASGNY
jgi:uncharacterized membrane protein YgcG